MVRYVRTSPVLMHEYAPFVHDRTTAPKSQSKKLQKSLLASKPAISVKTRSFKMFFNASGGSLRTESLLEKSIYY